MAKGRQGVPLRLRLFMAGGLALPVTVLVCATLHSRCLRALLGWLPSTDTAPTREAELCSC